MLENTDDFIYFKDNNHVFTADSQTLVSITNASNHWSELIGQTDYDVFPEKYADIYYALEKSVFARAKVAQDAQTYIDNSGNIGWVDNRKYPIKNDDGEIVGLFGIARDITDQKMAEVGNINNDFRWRIADEGNKIEEHLILSHFNKILSSKIFATLKKQKQLLEYLVRESYAGRGCKLKAFKIAVEALGADSEYDPGHDSAVRVIVKRLRESLARYYISHDDEVTVKFYIPKGHYEITFLRKIPRSSRSDLKLERPDKRKGNDRRHE
jgi:PAS domain S-box-containing protein